VSLILASEDEYEDLLGLWADLEAGLGVILAYPTNVEEFLARPPQYDRWMLDLLQRDTDVGLYLLFQLATHSSAGYSTSHALVCAVLCHLIAVDFALPVSERNSLVRAALTMNIAMTALQDQLANQNARPNLEQQLAIKSHASQGAELLGNMGVTDSLWLNIIELHHTNVIRKQERQTPSQRLAHILCVIDRYAAMISPRQSRVGRSAAESAQSLLNTAEGQGQHVEKALVRIVGLCPPGTFVQLDNGEVAVVTRRSNQPNLPDVAIVINQNGNTIKPPCLHRTALRGPAIQSALAASAAPDRINHHLILKLGMQST
jgi:HD-GYP domain-containing protein (c-di-GMP phosphodiesterase class II)